MNDNRHEEMLQQLESAANFMRGLAMDPRVQGDTKDYLRDKANEIDAFVERNLE